MINLNCIRDSNYINSDIEKTKRIIVATGCSFVFGSAAFSYELMSSYPPRYKNGSEWSFDHYDRMTQYRILRQFPSIVESQYYSAKYFECSAMFVDNSFPSFLRKKYFEGKYTVINLGMPSSGINASIMRLLLKPIRWDLAEEIILIFCPTSADRLSILVDDYNESNEYKSAWPNSAPHETKSFNKIQSGFGEEFFSEKWAVLNFLTNYQILLSWVKTYNAKLITFPSFNNYYNPTYITNQMKTRVIRDSQKQILDIIETPELDEAHKLLVNSVRWDTFIAPQGKQNFFDLAYSQETDYDPKLDHVSICGETGGSPTKWIMNCGHPGTKAHELLADEIYKHLEETDYCRKPWNIWT